MMLLHLQVSLSKFVGVDFDEVLSWVNILFLQGSCLVICNTMGTLLLFLNLYFDCLYP